MGVALFAQQGGQGDYIQLVSISDAYALSKRITMALLCVRWLLRAPCSARVKATSSLELLVAVLTLGVLGPTGPHLHAISLPPVCSCLLPPVTAANPKPAGGNM